MPNEWRSPRDDLRPLPRDRERLDTLDLYAHLTRGDAGTVTDPGRIARALESIKKNLELTTGQEGTLHGWRVQALFEAMVVSLGCVRLLKTEDSGSLYFSGPDITPPDFRIVTADDEQFLVEVKSHFQKHPTDDYTMRRKDVEALRRYAAAVGVNRVLLAVYWVKWRQWTATDLSVLEPHGQNALKLSMPKAFMASEMGLLGDRIPATEWPLSIRFVSDPNEPRSVEGNEFPFTIGAVEVFVAGKPIMNAEEQSIVMRLVLHSDWAESTEVEVVDGEAIAMRFDFAPQVPPEGNQPFAMHASLSTLFSTMFEQATTDDDGEITGLRIDVDPSALARLIPDDYEGEVLKIWRFRLVPN